MSDDAVRYLVLVMRGPGFDPALLPQHVAFLAALRTQALLELAGGFEGRSGGAYLLRGVADLAAAEAIDVADPLVANGASTAHVRGWQAH